MQTARQKRVAPRRSPAALTESQMERVANLRRKYGSLASHRIACELSLTHSLVSNYMKHLNREGDQ